MRGDHFVRAILPIAGIPRHATADIAPIGADPDRCSSSNWTKPAAYCATASRVKSRPMNAPVIYIHGFNSSPASFKAELIRRELIRRGRGVDFFAPTLPPSPADASRLLQDLVRNHPRAVLVGSSLGGYYATWMVERFALRAVLLNPAVRPYDLLIGEVGRQKNFHTGEDYDFTIRHIEEMRALEVENLTPDRYLLLAAKGDEVLDYRHAVERYRGAQQVLIESGDHGLSDFEQYLDQVFAFLGE